MDISPQKIRAVIFTLLIAFSLLIASCGQDQGSPYRTWIDYPPSGSLFAPGDAVMIAGHYYAGEPIGKVVLSVDDQTLAEISDPDPPPSPVGEILQEWIPAAPGDYLIELSLTDGEGDLISSAKVIVNVVESQEGAAESTGDGIFNQNGFCRSGPGTAYEGVAVFESGYQVQLEARSEPGIPLWWYLFDPVNAIYCWSSAAVIDTSVDPNLLVTRPSPALPRVSSSDSEDESDGLACEMGLNPEQCVETGGDWFVPMEALSDPYCKCPD